MIKIETLTKSLLLENIEKFCEIENIAVDTSNGLYRKPWNKENFLRELPGKWTYSRVIRSNNKIVGFWIGSQKTTKKGEGYLHGHRVAVLPDFREPNLLLEILNDLFSEARKNGLKWFTGYQAEYHPVMCMWYIRVMRCYIPNDRKTLEYFLGKLPDDVIIENDGRLVYPSGEGQYFIVKKLL